MHRRNFLSSTLAGGAMLSAQAAAPRELHPGIWKFTLGTPEKITPVSTRHYPPAASAFRQLPAVSACPVTPSGKAGDRGFLITLPLEQNEMVYGLGLQLQSFRQRGLKKKLRVNADPKMDTGDSHAPVPFYVTTRGYGVFVDTARYATFYCGNKRRKNEVGNEVLIDIPAAAGVDVYIFAGPALRQAGGSA